MASWILPSLVPPIGLWDHITFKKTKCTEQWVGPVEALVALAYKRFRPGAKLKIDSFKIRNDHSHPVKVWGEYNFDWQSVKRTILGGKGADMYNLKNPIYYSYIFLTLLPARKSELLMKLAVQSVTSMISDTYQEDQVALECLHNIKTILELALDGTERSSDDEEEYEELRDKLRISDKYLDNPLTKKSIEVWKSHLNWLETICDQLEIAEQKNMEGSDFEAHLMNIRVIQDKISTEMTQYYDKIIKGN